MQIIIWSQCHTWRCFVVENLSWKIHGIFNFYYSPKWGFHPFYFYQWLFSFPHCRVLLTCGLWRTPKKYSILLTIWFIDLVWCQAGSCGCKLTKTLCLDHSNGRLSLTRYWRYTLSSPLALCFSSLFLFPHRNMIADTLWCVKKELLFALKLTVEIAQYKMSISLQRDTYPQAC